MRKFAFYVLLSLSILVVCCAFDYADAVRGYNATGGKVFTIVLPLAIVTQKLSRAEHQINKSNQREKKYQQKLKEFQGM